MHVAVSIVGFRNPEDILRCLEALDRSTYSDFEVVICENGGPAAHHALAAVLPKALSRGQPIRAVLALGNLGYAGGVNLCLGEAPDADAWWVLNPDTAPDPGAMAAQVARLQVGDCDGVGCTLHLPGGQVQSHGGRWQPWLARAVSIGHGSPLDRRPDASLIERKQNYLNGASMMVSRRFVEVAGPMREDYFLYCEEVEWCLRARKRGLRLGLADALVLHFQGTTTGNSSDLAKRTQLPIYLSERNRILLTRDCFPARLPVVAATAFATLFAKYPRRGAWRQLGYGLAGWWAALRGERGVPAWLEVVAPAGAGI